MASVNYVRENIAFIEYASDNNVTANERLLWYALLHIFNMRAEGTCWPDGLIPVSNKRLLSFLPYKEDSLFEARNRLAQRGIIKYKAGQKNTQNPMYAMVYFSISGASNPILAGNMQGNIPGNVQGNMQGNIQGNVPGNDPDIYKPNVVVNLTQTQTHTQYGNDDAWRTSARVRGAVAQRILDGWSGRRDGYSDAHFDVCEYLSMGMTPDQISSTLKDCPLASLIPNHLHTQAVFLGIEKDDDAPPGY